MADNKQSPEELAHTQQLYADIVAKYYGDPDFKAKMAADPTATLKAEGWNVPDGVSIKLLFDTDRLLHIVLPTPN